MLNFEHKTSNAGGHPDLFPLGSLLPPVPGVADGPLDAGLPLLPLDDVRLVASNEDLLGSWFARWAWISGVSWQALQQQQKNHSKSLLCHTYCRKLSKGSPWSPGRPYSLHNNKESH